MSLVSGLAAQKLPTLQYTLRMEEPHSHYFQVELQVDNYPKNLAELKMATWTPGSYLIREYAKNVEAVTAVDANGTDLYVSKTSKNTWKFPLNGAKSFTVRYKVYCYELTVRNAYLDITHAYLNPAAVFFYLPGFEKAPATLAIKPYKDFQKVSTALKPVGKDPWTLAVPDWDTFVDSPLEIGNHETFDFEAAGVKHTVAMYGGGNYQVDRLKADMKRVVEAASSVVGEHPCQDYLFIVHNLPSGGGGLEHAHSTTLQASKYGYQNEQAYNGFLGLVAHEYFHLWNVKRIRPVELGPFNYESENYTRLLWVAEGFTSYYDDYILRRAGLISPDKYLDIVANNAGAIDNTPGSKVQSLAESSLDAWIKYYRPNENSNNATASYYTKGGVVAMLIDLDIRQSTEGQKSLDDVMRLLWNEYYKKQKRGFTEAEIQKAIETVAGHSFEKFFGKYIYGTEPLDLGKYLGYVGIQVKNRSEGARTPWLGMNTSNQGGRIVVTGVARNSPAWEKGLYVNDEILALDGQRVSGDINVQISNYKIGDVVKVLINRNNSLETLEIPISKSPIVGYRFEKLSKPSEQQDRLLKAWLRLE